MAQHNDLGKEGEALAAQWLVSKGYTLLHRNWRHAYHEIDCFDIPVTNGFNMIFLQLQCIKTKSRRFF